MKIPKFIEDAWSQQPGEYVIVSYKHEGDWKDVPFKKGDRAIVEYEPPEGADLYFCFNTFSRPRRREEFFESSPFLYADLDEVSPFDLVPKPNIAWQTSEGRFQAAWIVTHPLPVTLHKKINQRLTYLTGADKGGWSVTKALRIPGTRNYKYGEDGQEVRLLWNGNKVPHYSPQALAKLVKDVKVVDSLESLDEIGVPDVPPSIVLSRYRERLSPRSIDLYTTTTATVGERSERLWELECLLLSEGVPKNETLILVRNTVWNKYAGQARELSQLWKEVQKAAKHVREVGPTRSIPGRRLVLEDVDTFMARSLPTEAWVVEGVWSNDSHGLIAGEPKTFKSFISTELAVAVASGKPFLGVFDIPQRGPVWIVQEENTPAMMQDRIHKITVARGCGGKIEGGRIELPEKLPIKLMNNQGFNLRDEEHLSFLEAQLTSAREANELPKLIVLDPLYLMVPGLNESDQKDVSMILSRLLRLKQEHGVGILIVHHYNKPREQDDRAGGNRIAGSGVFYRWFQDAIYLSKGRTPGSVTMTQEHRGHAPVGAIHLDFDIGEMGEDDYYVDVEIRRTDTSGVRKQFQELMGLSPTVGLKLADIALQLDISKERVKSLADRLGYVIYTAPADGSQGRPPLMVQRPLVS